MGDIEVTVVKCTCESGEGPTCDACKLRNTVINKEAERKKKEEEAKKEKREAEEEAARVKQEQEKAKKEDEGKKK
ncbi:hypothetical protein F4821DRAFT_258977 [Hypoxylon rubiginosum]|uniref:Uncharacterized protein n=1 Tax=Hypoxylon rubiginosum TaxID=110542 RepID=A0ACC0D3J1_9PEZI|nr:hypothetical protein F4821DRAFT_258977 [Hypoxylon rubiginosum]